MTRTHVVFRGESVFLYDSLPEFFEAYRSWMGDTHFKQEVDGSVVPADREEWERLVRAEGVSAFTIEKKHIHLWASSDCPMSKVVEVLAHELGHIARPHYKDRGKEEAKAFSYGAVARVATEFALAHLFYDSEKEKT